MSENRIDDSNTRAKELKSALSTDNEKLRNCAGACEATGDKNSPKARNARFLINLHDSMISSVETIKNDGLLTPDAKLLTQDDLINEISGKFESKAEEIKANIRTQIESNEAKLFSNNISLSASDISLLSNAPIIDKITKAPLDFMDNEANASIIAFLNARGLMGKENGLKDALNRRHTPEPFTTLQDLSDELDEIKSILRSEQRITRQIKPSQLKIEKIRKAKYGGRISTK